jgi:hypothetical protein
MAELKKQGVEYNDAMKALSLLGTLQVGALHRRYKAWTDNQVKQLRKLCNSGYTIPSIVDRIDGSMMKKRVANKIHELGIYVFVRGSFKLIKKRN